MTPATGTVKDASIPLSKTPGKADGRSPRNCPLSGSAGNFLSAKGPDRVPAAAPRALLNNQPKEVTSCLEGRSQSS